MKTIGLLGGMSWESTVTYYQTINALVKQQLGGFHSAKILLYSVNFDPIEKLQHKGDWAGTAEILTKAAMNLENGGADFLLICTNTMHRVAPQIQESLTIPILHIADATAEELKKSKINKVGLLGTAFTMEHDFYKGRLREKHGLKVITPDQEDRNLVHDVIYNELCMGKFNENSKNAYMQVIEKLKESGAEAVILGCTEIALLVGKEKTSIPMFDTAKIHAQQSVKLALD